MTYGPLQDRAHELIANATNDKTSEADLNALLVFVTRLCSVANSVNSEHQSRLALRSFISDLEELAK